MLCKADCTVAASRGQTWRSWAHSVELHGCESGGGQRERAERRQSDDRQVTYGAERFCLRDTSCPQ